MLQERTMRRLAAILAADVVGYSRLMAADETGTLDALKRHREAVFNPAVEQHGGRIVKLIGDGTLVEFGSVVDAVRCALAIQLAAAAAAHEASPAITLRIGVNLGDVIIEGDDIYGDGVNVAARLEPLAEPGGICIASIVNESVGSRVDARFEDGGEVQVKNIDRPIRVWKWRPSAEAVRPAPVATAGAPVAAAAKAEPATAEIPSIAVLPFANMSGDAEQEYFSDGITEDILTDLSKVGGLMVIARNSSFAYKGRNVDIRTVGRELGVRSVLEGSIRRAGNRVRITAQLIDAATGSHLWAERYDRDLTDIFAVQDEVTREIVAALKITLSPREQARLAGAGTKSIEAHDLLLKGRQIMLAPNLNRTAIEQAVALMTKAVEIDPQFAQAYAGLALADTFDYNNHWTEDSAAVLRRGDEFARRAEVLAPDDPLALFAVAITARFLKDNDRSQRAVAKALALSPNFGPALNMRGVFAMYDGNPEAGIPDLEKAIRLDPGFSQQYLHFLGLAHFMLGHYETAAMMFRERIILSPETDVTRSALAATLGHLGRIEEARRIWAELKAINPRYSLDDHLDRLPFRNPADPARFREGLAKAGLPD
jgi:adenylate cyclase